MFSNEKSVQFQGFRPSDFTQTYLNEKVDQLFEEAPAGSNIKAIFTRKGRLIKGIVTIYSSVGRFFAVASDYKINEVANILTQQIRRQLEKWKSNRFKHERIQDAFIEANNNNLTKEDNYDSDHVA